MPSRWTFACTYHAVIKCLTLVYQVENDIMICSTGHIASGCIRELFFYFYKNGIAALGLSELSAMHSNYS